MRVLLPTLEYAPERGGIARYLAAIVRTFPNDIQVEHWSTWPGYVVALRTLWTKRGTYDQLLVSHVLPIGTVAWLLWPLTRKSYVVILHGMDFDLARRNVWKRWLLRRILGCSAIIVNSKALASEVTAFIGSSKTPVHVISPCVSDELVEASVLVGRQPVADRPLTLLTVSRLVERKGHLKVIRALVNFPDVRYRIVGDGAMRNQILNLAKSLGVQDRVEILQSLPDGKLPEVYRQSDVFVMPTMRTQTDREGFGTVYLEAQLFGVPVVATKQPGVDEAVLDGTTGLLTDESQESFEAALGRLLKDADLRARFGATGRERVLREFTREHQMGKFAAVWKS
ncbi:MAG: glycosyltransferase family 4 protein, partial [Candidatus Uhrbacteria bacterium]|nr:glycosyltransferase family 4 protein [Candidatus Uhrbacteria bacterium]